MTKYNSKTKLKTVDTVSVPNEIPTSTFSVEDKWTFLDVERIRSDDTLSDKTNISSSISITTNSDINTELSWNELWSEALTKVYSKEKGDEDNKDDIASNGSYANESGGIKRITGVVNLDAEDENTISLNHRSQLANETDRCASPDVEEFKIDQNYFEDEINVNYQTNVDDENMHETSDTKTTRADQEINSAFILTAKDEPHNFEGLTEGHPSKRKPDDSDYVETCFGENRSPESLEELCKAIVPKNDLIKMSFSDSDTRQKDTCENDNYLENDSGIAIYDHNQEYEKQAGTNERDINATIKIRLENVKENVYFVNDEEMNIRSEVTKHDGDRHLQSFFHDTHVYGLKTDKVDENNTIQDQVFQTYNARDIHGTNEKSYGLSSSYQETETTDYSRVDENTKDDCSKLKNQEATQIIENTGVHTLHETKAQDSHSEDRKYHLKAVESLSETHILIRICSGEENMRTDNRDNDTKLKEAYEIYLDYEAKRCIGAKNKTAEIAKDTHPCGARELKIFKQYVHSKVNDKDVAQLIRIGANKQPDELNFKPVGNEKKEKDSIISEPSLKDNHEIELFKETQQRVESHFKQHQTNVSTNYEAIAGSRHKEEFKTDGEINKTRCNDTEDRSDKEHDRASCEKRSDRCVSDTTTTEISTINNDENRTSNKLIANLILPLPALDRYSLDSCKIKNFKTTTEDNTQVLMELEINYKIEEESRTETGDNVAQLQGERNCEASVCKETVNERKSNVNDYDNRMLGVGARPKTIINGVQRNRNHGKLTTPFLERK